MRLARILDPVEIRVLGSLLEKQQATPDAYPLTLNALVAACNQRSNREPVTDFTEREVLAALERLRETVLVWKVTGGRAERWEHNLDLRWELDPPARAVVTLLFLRGAQTPGEIRSRSDRLFGFESLEQVETVLAGMAKHPEPLVAELGRRPGQKESRWAHLVAGPPVEAPADAPAPAPVTHQAILSARVDALEERLVRVETELAELRRALGS